MPTGSGKSGAISLIPLLLAPRRVLVVAPSRIVIDQLAKELRDLTTLRRVGSVGDNTKGPRVSVATQRLASDGDWHSIADDSDIVLGTPNVMSPASPGVTAAPASMFDLIIFDEAHHTPAKTYAAIVANGEQARIAMFTATPFRRDKKELPGKIVYTYTLRQALNDKILSPIEFRPVDAPDAPDQRTRDEVLARRANERYHSPEHLKVDSRIIARTKTVAHARDLVGIYAHAGLKMGLVTAATSRDSLRTTVGAVRDGGLHGLISVGALGEGFDLPRLKIGVYHHQHASLPATLQFLGRITRVLPEAPPAELLAIPREVSDETAELYAADGAWADLVPQLADAAVDDEASRREYLRSFDPLPTRPLSLAALRPRKYVQVLEMTPELNERLDWDCTIERLSSGEVIYKGIDGDSRVAVVISEHLDRPEWLDSDTLDRFRYELHVLVVDSSGRFAFVHGTRDSSIAEFVAYFGLEDARIVEPMWFDRLMSSVSVDGYHSLGMRSARAVGETVAAYRQMAGHSVGGAVSSSETRTYGSGHAIAQVRDPMRVSAEQVMEGEIPPNAPSTSLGVSYARARVFSPDLAQLQDFRRWCERLVSLVDAQDGVDISGLPHVALRSPRRLREFPNGAYLCTVDPAVLGQGVDIRSGQISERIDECEMLITSQSEQYLEIEIRCDAGDLWAGRIDVSGSVSTLGHDAQVWLPSSTESVSVVEFMQEIPPQIFYANGTSTVGTTLFQASADYPELTEPLLMAWGFEAVDIRRESRPARDNFEHNIKQYSTNWIATNRHPAFLIDDDRANEIADLIYLVQHKSDLTDRVAMTIGLAHLKFSSEDASGHRIGDLYELAGQAARSARWCDAKAFASRLTQRLAGGSSVLSGDAFQLSEVLAKIARGDIPCEFEVFIVQPGLRMAGINSSRNIRIMINDVRDWVAGHGAELRVVGCA